MSDTLEKRHDAKYFNSCSKCRSGKCICTKTLTNKNISTFDALKSRVIEFLSFDPTPTLTISKHIYGPDATCSMINPILYKMKDLGITDKISDDNGRHPKWYLRDNLTDNSNITPHNVTKPLHIIPQGGTLSASSICKEQFKFPVLTTVEQQPTASVKPLNSLTLRIDMDLDTSDQESIENSEFPDDFNISALNLRIIYWPVTRKSSTQESVTLRFVPDNSLNEYVQSSDHINRLLKSVVEPMPVNTTKMENSTRPGKDTQSVLPTKVKPISVVPLPKMPNFN